jgi:hypothetical protein
MQLDNILARGEVAQQAEAIDRVYGTPGSFRNLVIEEARAHFLGTGQDLPADQAVQMAAAKYGRFITAQQNAVTSNQFSGGAPQATQQGQVPIIPHVGGSARSPIKKQPRSLDDIKALAKSMNN